MIARNCGHPHMGEEHRARRCARPSGVAHSGGDRGRGHSDPEPSPVPAGCGRRRTSRHPPGNERGSVAAWSGGSRQRGSSGFRSARSRSSTCPSRWNRPRRRAVAHPDRLGGAGCSRRSGGPRQPQPRGAGRRHRGRASARRRRARRGGAPARRSRAPVSPPRSQHDSTGCLGVYRSGCGHRSLATSANPPAPSTRLTASDTRRIAFPSRAPSRLLSQRGGNSAWKSLVPDAARCPCPSPDPEPGTSRCDCSRPRLARGGARRHPAAHTCGSGCADLVDRDRYGRSSG